MNKGMTMRFFVKGLFQCITLLCVILVAACSTNSMNAMAQAKQDFIAQNYELSYQKVKPAADQGDADAQYALGYMMYYGKGTPRDADGSYVWFHKAAAQGQPQAIKALAMLNQIHQQAATPAPVVQAHPAQALAVKPRPVVSTPPLPPHMAATDAAPTPVHSVSPYLPAHVPTHAVVHAPQVVPTTHPSAVHSSDSVRDIAGVKPASVAPPVVYKPAQAEHHVHAPQHSVTLAAAPISAVSWVSEQALLKRPGDHYTIQIMGASNKQALQHYASQHNLQQVSIYSTMLHGKAWHVLLQGDYPNHDSAAAAIPMLVAKLKTVTPWVRAMAPIQADIRSNAESPIR